MVKNRFFSLRPAVVTMLISAAFVCTLAGCGSEGSVSGETDHSNIPGGSTASDHGQSDGEHETDFPGSYTVPDGWMKLDKYSTKNKLFYVQEGHEDDELPDNISIEIGTNRYSADEHEKFRDAIVRQLTMQIQGLDAELTGSGTFTAQEDVLYIFTIREKDVVTRQFYIVGDQRYCLIHLTNFTGSEQADDAAQAMADSFVWN